MIRKRVRTISVNWVDLSVMKSFWFSPSTRITTKVKHTITHNTLSYTYHAVVSALRNDSMMENWYLKYRILILGTWMELDSGNLSDCHCGFNGGKQTRNRSYTCIQYKSLVLETDKKQLLLLAVNKYSICYFLSFIPLFVNSLQDENYI